jgi:hypothetical protein
LAAAFTFTMTAPVSPAGAKELRIATFMGPPHYLNRVVFTNLS